MYDNTGKYKFNPNCEQELTKRMHTNLLIYYWLIDVTDIFVEFIIAGEKHALLIEVKVHDYLSATDGQIGKYFNAVLEDGVYDEVYFIYLTQFVAENDLKGVATPKTIDEAKKGKEIIKQRFAHISWHQMHSFLNKHYDMLPEEQQLIVSLNKQWISQQCESDLESNKIDVGEIEIEDYFFDVKIDIRNSLYFGNEVCENKRLIWRIDTSGLEEKQLNIILDVIKILAGSDAVNRIKQYRTEELALQGAKGFLVQMAQSLGDWRLLAFYSRLFLFAEKIS